MLTQSFKIIILLGLLWGDVSLRWEPSPSGGVVSYKVYYGVFAPTPELQAKCDIIKALDTREIHEELYLRQYNNSDDGIIQTAFTVRDIVPGNYAFFAVSAVDLNGNESGPSNEVCTFLEVPDFPFQVLGGAVSVNWFGVVVQVTTDRDTAAILRYALQENELHWITTVVTEGARKRIHTALLRPDTPGNYYYEWTLSDAEGNELKHASSFSTKP